MGTKLQYAISLLNDNSFSVNNLEDSNYFQNKENLQRADIGKFQYSMDKIIEQHNIESIKKTMLLHEDIFQHQVRELHQLYNVQKRLMNEIKNQIKQNRFAGTTANPNIDRSRVSNRHQQTSSNGYILHFQGVGDNPIPSPREQSGSCSGETLRMPKGFDLERPAEEAISIDAQIGPSSHTYPKNSSIRVDRYDESDVELTLSIGGSDTGKKRSKSHDRQRGEEVEDCSGNNNNTMTSSSSTSTIMEQQNKRPHWLFQGLSLNRT